MEPKAEELQEELYMAPNDTQAALEAGIRIGRLESAARGIDICGVPALLVPEGLTVQWLEQWRDRPRRIEAERHFIEASSFCAYVVEFKGAGTRIYADDSMKKLVAVLDDHDEDPSWCDHRAVLDLNPSNEWEAWTGQNKKPMKHLDFVEFLQEQIGTIAKPDASGIIAAARSFSASRNAKFDQVLPVEGGDLSVAYSEEVRGVTKSGSASLPQRLTLLLRPYRSGKAYPVEAQVRWRLSREGELTFSFALLETSRVLETAFADVRLDVAAATDLLVHV